MIKQNRFNTNSGYEKYFQNNYDQLHFRIVQLQYLTISVDKFF